MTDANHRANEMAGARTLAPYLAAQMRAKDRVAEALAHHGLPESTLTDARLAAEAAGLEAVPVRIEHVYAFLGPPTRTEANVGDYDRFDYYRLDLWPQHEVALLSARGFFGGFEFRLAAPHRHIIRAEDLAVWSTTEAELLTAPGKLTKVEEWYPRRDYKLTLRDSRARDVTRYVEFDFGLLQAVSE